MIFTSIDDSGLNILILMVVKWLFYFLDSCYIYWLAVSELVNLLPRWYCPKPCLPFLCCLRLYALVARQMHFVVTKIQPHASPSNTVQMNLKQLTLPYVSLHEQKKYWQNPPNNIFFKFHWPNRVKWPYNLSLEEG